MTTTDDEARCPICGMEFDNEDDLDVHLLDCEAEQLDALDAD